MTTNFKGFLVKHKITNNINFVIGFINFYGEEIYVFDGSDDNENVELSIEQCVDKIIDAKDDIVKFDKSSNYNIMNQLEINNFYSLVKEKLEK